MVNIYYYFKILASWLQLNRSGAFWTPIFPRISFGVIGCRIVEPHTSNHMFVKKMTLACLGFRLHALIVSFYFFGMFRVGFFLLSQLLMCKGLGLLPNTQWFLPRWFLRLRLRGALLNMLALLILNWIGRMPICGTTFKTILCYTSSSNFGTLRSLQESKWR